MIDLAALNDSNKLTAKIEVTPSSDTCVSDSHFSYFRKMTAERCIKTSAKIISPAIENTYSEGYDW